MFGNPYQQYQPQGYQPFGTQLPTFQEVEGPDSIQMLRIPPNSKHVYFDRRLDRFYTVSTDAAGAKFVEAYDFALAQEPKQPQYLTLDEFNAWRSQYEQLVQQSTKPAVVPGVRTQHDAAAGAGANPADAPVGASHARAVPAGN